MTTDLRVRDARPDDVPRLVELTIETFRPFYEESFPALVGHDEELVAHQHGEWEQEYRDTVPGLLAPDEDRHVLLAESPEGEVVGYVAWCPEGRPDHVQITHVAVAPGARRDGVATTLMEHTFARLRAAGVGVVGLGTGGDDFHAPARALYERLGFHRIPITGYLRRL